MLSGVATLTESADVAFIAGDEVVTSLHVNIPNVLPLMTRLKRVVVDTSGASHVLFDNYTPTEKGVANNLEHTSEDDTVDSTTFRLSSVSLGMPASDPVFARSGAVDAYTISSIATVEYQTPAGRRVADVTTMRSVPAKRAASTLTVDVIASSVVSIDARAAGAGGVTGDVAKPSSNNTTTIVIVSISALVGVALVVVGSVYLVKGRLMHSRVEVSKNRANMYSRKAASSGPAAGAGVFLGDVNVAASPRAVAPAPAHVGEAEPQAVVARAASGKPKAGKKLRASKSTGASVSSSAPVAGPSAAASDAAPAQAHAPVTRKARKMRPVSSA